jgi:hypothetical protein
MRVLAASFVDDTRAHEARAKLLADLELEPHQVGVEILARPSGDAASPAVLAGQFDERLATVARKVLEQYGGTLMVDIDAGETNA